MNARRRSWAIVGGGVLGAVLARALARDGDQVTLYEAEASLGGLASAWRLGDVTWDRHYHVTLLSDLRLRALLAELGLEREIRWVQTRTGVFWDDRLHSLSNAWEFLRFPALSLVDKARLGATITWASRIRDARPLERIPVADWLVRWSGRRGYERFWAPLLRSKLGEHDDVSAAFIRATIARLYAARSAGLKQERFGYVPGGYARVLQALTDDLARAGVDVRTGSRVDEVGSEGGLVRVRVGEATDVVDRVVLTTPSPVVARICPTLPVCERLRHAGVRYQGVVCASVLLKRPLAGYYVTNLLDDDLPFTGVIELTALVDPATFGGRGLVYLPRYVRHDDPIFDASDDDLRASFLAGLRRVYPQIGPDDVLAFQVSRVRHVMPVPTLGYSDRLPPIASAIPGIFVVNAAQIVDGTLNVDETVRLAERALPLLRKTGADA